VTEPANKRTPHSSLGAAFDLPEKKGFGPVLKANHKSRSKSKPINPHFPPRPSPKQLEMFDEVALGIVFQGEASQSYGGSCSCPLHLKLQARRGGLRPMCHTMPWTCPKR
jgi:hypothetical protein